MTAAAKPGPSASAESHPPRHMPPTATPAAPFSEGREVTGHDPSTRSEAGWKVSQRRGRVRCWLHLYSGRCGYAVEMWWKYREHVSRTHRLPVLARVKSRRHDRRRERNKRYARSRLHMGVGK